MNGGRSHGAGPAPGPVPSVSRRQAVGRLLGLGILSLTHPTALVARPVASRLTHPEPRPGIDGSRVLTRDQVAPHAADLFDQIRAIPHVVDGIGCHCGCGDLPGMVSLLSCYEGTGMAQYCQVCSGEGRLAARLHGEGRSLDEIRAAVDRRFG